MNGIAKALKRRRIDAISSNRKRTRFRLFFGAACLLFGLVLTFIGMVKGNI